MKPAHRVYFFAFVLPLMLAGIIGCAAPVRTADNYPSVAIVVRLAGGGKLSPQQLINIHRAVRDDITDAGYHLARNTDVAQFLLTVRFTPDGLDPDGGHVVITGIEPNPLNRRGRYVGQGVPAGAKEQEQKIRDIERWIQSQSKALATAP